MCTCDSPAENLLRQGKIRRMRLIFILVYVVNFTAIAILFFSAVIPGIKEPSIGSPRVVAIWYK